MGCGSSKTLTKAISTKKEFRTPLQKKPNAYEEILVSKNGTDHQFITLLCSSNTPAKQLREQESSKQSSPIRNDASQTKSFNSMAPIIEKPEDFENNIETINSWELLAGLEEDDQEVVEEQREKGSSMSFNTIKQCSKSSRCDGIEQDDTNAMKQEGDGNKGLRRKLMVAELASLKVPAFEFARTGSLRDWLIQGGQVMSNGSHLTPKFGSFEHPGASGTGESCAEDVFEQELVAQLEQAMEELTMEEEEILNHIVEKWESNVRRSFEGWK